MTTTRTNPNHNNLYPSGAAGVAGARGAGGTGTGGHDHFRFPMSALPTTSRNKGDIRTNRTEKHPSHKTDWDVKDMDADIDHNDTTGSSNNNNDVNNNNSNSNDSSRNDMGRLEALKLLEQQLSQQLALVRQEKLRTLQSRPLTIGIIGFGRFGQFIAQRFQKYGRVVVTSRTDYTEIAQSMGVTYISLSKLDEFVAQSLDVIVVAVSIVSFEDTIKMIAPYLQAKIQNEYQQQQLQLQPPPPPSLLNHPTTSDVSSHSLTTATTTTTTTTATTSPIQVQGPLIVDVLSVKEHARNIMLQYLPVECDILCTHPMFGPDSGKHSWKNLNFVYERTRIHQNIVDPDSTTATTTGLSSTDTNDNTPTKDDDNNDTIDSDSDAAAYVEGMDRMERFLSIWEEEGCHMVPLSCRDHDAYAANSQFITHLIGRVLGSQGLTPTPIDTSGFQSVLKLIDTTTADSFDLFYGLYKYNQNSYETIKQLQAAMEEVVQNLQIMEQQEEQK